MGRSRVVICGVLTLALLLVGVAWRWPALHPAASASSLYGRFTYSDIVMFYGERFLSQHQVPYLQQPMEYPVLIGGFAWLSSFAPHLEGYFLVNAVVLAACLMATFVLLARLDPPVPLLRFALAPALALYVVLNWDALAVVWLVAALSLTRSGRMGWAGACLAAGAAAKLFPLFAFPILLAQAWQAPAAAAGDGGQANPAGLLGRVPGPARRFMLGFGLVTLALNLPVALASPHGWAYPYLWQAARTPNADSIWASLPQTPELVSTLVFALALVLGTLWFALAVPETGRWQEAVLLSLLLFCLFTKIYSPQYDLWLVPLLVMLCCPLPLWLAFVLADLAYYATVFAYYAAFLGGVPLLIAGNAALALRSAVWAREFVFVALFAWALTRFYGTSLPAVGRRLARAGLPG